MNHVREIQKARKRCRGLLKGYSPVGNHRNPTHPIAAAVSNYRWLDLTARGLGNYEWSLWGLYRASKRVNDFLDCTEVGGNTESMYWLHKFYLTSSKVIDVEKL